MMRTHTTPVLVVGAGPAGLVASIQLARYGLPVLLIERRADNSALPRATAISMRTMELLRGWGLEPAVRAVATDARPAGLLTPALTVPGGMELPIGYPTAQEAAGVSPTYPALAPQDDLEPILLEHLVTYPQATMRFGTELVLLAQDGDGVTAEVRDVATGEISTVRARYVIGADGAHSVVRDQLGIGMTGPDNLSLHTTVLFRAPLWEAVGERRYGLYIITNPSSPGVLVPSGRGDRWLFGREWPDRQAPERDRVEELVPQIRIAAGVPDLMPRVERIGRFGFAAKMADRFRDRRAFLVGDAAHRVTPRGGTGMNTAIHDAYDLGWRLAWVLSGWSGSALLDGYETERMPVGARNVARSARLDGSHLSLADGIADDLAGRLPHAWVGDEVSTLDLLGSGLTVLTGPDGAGCRQAVATAGCPVPVVVHELDEPAAVAVGIEPSGALLARPDGHVVTRWPAMESFRTTALRIGLDTLLGRPEATAA
jgi:2-polyprenyl-6-methoxyphenol hydroxylase-like FAD-dependent oxidoreductase